MGGDDLKAEIAVIGGSGVYALDLLQDVEATVVDTPYGRSPEVIVGKLDDRRVAFLPRHGKGHTVPPHMVNYRANLWALHELGVKRVLATTASGSINSKMRPGELALLDQFVDFTKRRPATFYEGGERGVVHIDVTEPYCPELRSILTEAARELKIKLHPRAVYACMDGPRFETAAEIRALRRLGCDLVGMTNVPECVLARELELCYAAVAVVTNFAAGISRAKLTHAEVAELMATNIERVKRLLFSTISRIPAARSCACGKALEGAVVKV
ncbi:MAG: S-methyl-5'-thioadenosine phosphorylase [Candidatus Hodarchaeaceae archaeon]|nr:S-methyl-5'-thioadenosine phosphorylase [Candidatus Hodarchaeaceae archaeon]